MRDITLIGYFLFREEKSMITEKETIKCESIFSEDRQHRYLLKRIWNKAKPLATVIMLNPCDADSLITDTTTFLVINNIVRMEKFGGVAILNLYSKLSQKLDFKWNSDENLNTKENDEYIISTAKEAEAIILAWGRAQDTNKRVEERALNIINLLLPFREKMFLISDGNRIGMHPLTPSLRNQWLLEPFDEALKKRTLQEQEKAKISETAKQEKTTTPPTKASKASNNQAKENVLEEVVFPVDSPPSPIEDSLNGNVPTVTQGNQE